MIVLTKAPEISANGHSQMQKNEEYNIWLQNSQDLFIIKCYNSKAVPMCIVLRAISSVG